MAKDEKKSEKDLDPADVKAKADAEALAIAEAAKQAAEEAKATEGLVKMHKDGEKLHVHPTTVGAHIEAGWNLA